MSEPSDDVRPARKADAAAIAALHAAGLSGSFLASLGERFLTSLNAEYEKLGKESNTDYITDLAGRHFNHIRLRRAGHRHVQRQNRKKNKATIQKPNTIAPERN